MTEHRWVETPGDIRWPSSNDLEIPDLLLEREPLSVELPLVAWGARCRAREFKGTWQFYVSDYRFSYVWQKPETIPATGALGAVEVNYSVFDQTPFPFALWATYRKRWLARYWQEKGLRVWVDLNVSESHSELNLYGVPKGWRHYATRGYDERVDDLRREYELAGEHADREPVLLVYGGGSAIAGACSEMPGAIHFPERTGPRHWKNPKPRLVLTRAVA